MKTVLVLLALVLLWPGVGAARDKDGGYIYKGGGCGSYVAEFERDRRERDSSGKVTLHFARAYGWIMGYITAYNAWVDNGKEDIAEGIDEDSITLWVANWCRDNPLKNTAAAMAVLMHTLEAK